MVTAQLLRKTLSFKEQPVPTDWSQLPCSAAGRKLLQDAKLQLAVRF